MGEEEPLIWTTKGNIPVSSLKYEAKWVVAQGDFVKLVEEYRLNDEVVRSNAHVLSLRGLGSESLVTSL
jgi:hypothetical protein